MICATCRRERLVPIVRDGYRIGYEPCPDCLGGEQHCCEGERSDNVNLPGLTFGYWRRETTGVLRPAVEAYLSGGTMTPEQIAAMRAYLRQWIMSPVWAGGIYLDPLRRGVDDLTSRDAISSWLEHALRLGIDPL